MSAGDQNSGDCDLVIAVDGGECDCDYLTHMRLECCVLFLEQVQYSLIACGKNFSQSAGADSAITYT